MKTSIFFTVICACLFLSSCKEQSKGKWVSTTFENPWVEEPTIQASNQKVNADILIDATKTAQTIDGFGTCFNELGWTSLSKLNTSQRDSIFHESHFRSLTHHGFCSVGRHAFAKVAKNKTRGFY